MAEGILTVAKREETGKQAAKHMRLTGNIPGVLYGPGIDPISLTINSKELISHLHSFGRNSVVNLVIGKSKKKITSFIYDIQHDPISGDITHVDLKQISLDEKLHVTVPVHLIGAAWGVKNEGGIVEHLMHAVDILCLPSEIPSEFTVDITDMHLGDVVHVRDIVQESFEMISESDSVIVHIIAPKIVQVEEEEEELVSEEEGAAEPEVIGEKKAEESQED